MAVLYGPRANITRLYFGTDTHAQSILVGAVLACSLTLIQRHRGLTGMAPVAKGATAKVILTVIGLAGFAGTLALTKQLTGTSSLAYRGGFLLSALSAAAIILGAVCVAGGPIARVLSVRPLVWMGTVSYGAYLWHYPVFIELDAARTGMSGLSLLAVRGLATFVLAGLSYYLVERPVMEGVFWRSLKAAGPAIAAMGVTVVVVVAGTIAPVAAAVDVGAARHIPTAEYQALSSSHAFSTDPVRFLFVGDSLSVTMGVGLAVDTVRNFGVSVINEGDLGCDLDPLPTISTTNGLQDNPQTSCADWERLWTGEIAEFHPQVVGVLIGRWDILDHVEGNAIVHIGQPAWDRHLTSEIDHVADVLSAHGVRVVFFSMPYIDPTNETLNGALSPEDSPTRVDEFNHLLAVVAARHPGRVSVIDLNRILDPHGEFQSVIDGVTVRWADGIHISKPGGEWLQARVLPTIAQLGLSARTADGTLSPADWINSQVSGFLTGVEPVPRQMAQVRSGGCRWSYRRPSAGRPAWRRTRRQPMQLTNRIRLRIDLALAHLDESPSLEPGPTPAPAPRTPGSADGPLTGRADPLAADRELSPRFGSSRVAGLRPPTRPAPPPGPVRRDYAGLPGWGLDPAEEVSPRLLRSHPDQAARTTRGDHHDGQHRRNRSELRSEPLVLADLEQRAGGQRVGRGPPQNGQRSGQRRVASAGAARPRPACRAGPACRWPWPGPTATRDGASRGRRRTNPGAGSWVGCHSTTRS